MRLPKQHQTLAAPMLACAVAYMPPSAFEQRFTSESWDVKSAMLIGRDWGCNSSQIRSAARAHDLSTSCVGCECVSAPTSVQCYRRFLVTLQGARARCSTNAGGELYVAVSSNTSPLRNVAPERSRRCSILCKFRPPLYVSSDHRAISALGQKQTCALHSLMSALPPKTTANATY